MIVRLQLLRVVSDIDYRRGRDRRSRWLRTTSLRVSTLNCFSANAISKNGVDWICGAPRATNGVAIDKSRHESDRTQLRTTKATYPSGNSPPQTQQALEDALMEKWGGLPELNVWRLVRSARRRCEAVIRASADHRCREIRILTQPVLVNSDAYRGEPLSGLQVNYGASSLRDVVQEILEKMTGGYVALKLLSFQTVELYDVRRSAPSIIAAVCVFSMQDSRHSCKVNIPSKNVATFTCMGPRWLSASQQGEPGSIPRRVTGFLQVGIVSDDATGWRVSRGSPVSPALSFRRCSILTAITLNRSQDLAVKSRPNLFTCLGNDSGGTGDWLCGAAVQAAILDDVYQNFLLSYST
ncbi:hypothetical protein PR048_018633 [Dryococelus australis]|uniref:Uncharacterized protein n=1 Tax=Dryococelus australis TaxID=614101 RepID=A0ABQ9HD34_9NEOP|nr:hypothetical protein PR048_018633 [Dryococelus australis]